MELLTTTLAISWPPKNCIVLASDTILVCYKRPVLVSQKHCLYRYVYVVIIYINSLFFKSGKTDICFLKYSDNFKPYTIEFDILAQRINFAEEFCPDVGTYYTYLYTIILLVIIKKTTCYQRKIIQLKIII